MSKFDYKAEGELNSNYLLDLLNDYLDKIATANDTKGIVEDDFKINTKSNAFVKAFRHNFTRFKLGLKNKSLLENYNKVLSTKYVNSVKKALQIYLETNVLEAKQIFDLKCTLEAINFGIVIPEIDENRESVIKKSQKQLLKALNDIKYLKDARIDYVLFNSPVAELKPFLSDKVSTHLVNVEALQMLLRQYVAVRYNELTAFNFEHTEIEFKAKEDDFYAEMITDNGIGADVENFIKGKMLEKLKIMRQDDTLIEDRQEQIGVIDTLLKRLKVNKIEQMLQNLIKLKLNLAKAKEVVDKCKDIINSSTITNKARIFLIMDNLYYNMAKKCETLGQKVKLKLQLVDKQKLFATLALINNPDSQNVSKRKSKSSTNVNDEPTNVVKPSIASNLYDDDETDEIHITEDDGEAEAEDEVIIDDEN